ncbi:MAG: hypothetical protein CMO61_10410 [Verrucomicrobiales bacterium]|jgi:hypothetical protein|nr:hypothetical protein [Verrucomicrobiales bacterium]|tara:strand:+ start:9545 stop:9898 length:354 start_codon:yes stop_codon:yes gene_type:complete
MKQSLGLVVTLVFVAASISSRENFQSSQEVRELRPIAAVDIKNSINGETPAGTKIKEGMWTVDAEAEILEAAAEPLVQSWLEFGPEIREKIATIKGGRKSRGTGENTVPFWGGVVRE